MSWVGLSILLAAHGALPDATASPSPPTRPGVALASAVVTLGVSTGLAAAAGYLSPSIHFSEHGSPDPWLTTLSIAFGTATQVLLAHFLVPEALRIGGLRDAEVERVRAVAFRYTRWPALTGVLSVIAFGAGAQLERVAYGQGQYLLLAGVLGTAVSWVLFDVLEVVGLNRGLH